MMIQDKLRPIRADGLKTLGECVEEYLVYITGVLSVSENTVKAYQNDLTGLLKMPFIDKNAPVSLVETEDLRRSIGELSKKHRASSTINRFIASFRSLFAYCRRLGYISINPAISIHSVREPKRLPRFMTQAEIDALCSEPTKNEILWKERDVALFEVLYSSGCRVGEIAGLSIDNVSDDFSQALVTGKGKKDRIVYFSLDATRALSEYLKSRAERFGEDDCEKSLFVNQHGGALSVRGIAYILNRYSGVEGTNHRVSPHAFRHTFATAMISAGADVRLVQELLGHSSISTTQRYTHISTEKLIAMYNKAHPHGK